MALVKCPKCNNEISDKSLVCMYCGFPVSIVHSKRRIDNKPNSANSIKHEKDIMGISHDMSHDLSNCIMDVRCPRCCSNEVKVVYHKRHLQMDCKNDRIQKICRNCKHEF